MGLRMNESSQLLGWCSRTWNASWQSRAIPAAWQGWLLEALVAEPATTRQGDPRVRAIAIPLCPEHNIRFRPSTRPRPGNRPAKFSPFAGAGRLIFPSTFKIIGRFNNKLVRLMLGLYLPKNWHPLVCQESLMTPQSSSQLFLISHPLQPLLVPYWVLSYFRHCTWWRSQPLLEICILKRLGSFVNYSLWMNLSMWLLTSCNNSNLTNQSIDHCLWDIIQD